MKTMTPHSAENLAGEAGVKDSRWKELPSDAVVKKTVEALKANGFDAVVVDSSKAALDELTRRIPKGAEVMNGSSTTLAEIGFLDLLKERKTTWKNVHDDIFSEKDKNRQAVLRRKATASEWFVSSANALTQDGQLVGADASGSRTGAWLFSAQNLVIVAGTNKIAKDLPEAMQRVREYAFALENVRAQKVYGMGSGTHKWAVLSKEYGPRVTVILVNESLGY